MPTPSVLWARMHRFAGYVTILVGIAVGLSGLFLSRQEIASVVGICAMGAVASLSFAYWRLTKS